MSSPGRVQTATSDRRRHPRRPWLPISPPFSITINGQFAAGGLRELPQANGPGETRRTTADEEDVDSRESRSDIRPPTSPPSRRSASTTATRCMRSSGAGFARARRFEHVSAHGAARRTSTRPNGRARPKNGASRVASTTTATERSRLGRLNARRTQIELRVSRCKGNPAALMPVVTGRAYEVRQPTARSRRDRTRSPHGLREGSIDNSKAGRGSRSGSLSLQVSCRRGRSCGFTSTPSAFVRVPASKPVGLRHGQRRYE